MITFRAGEASAGPAWPAVPASVAPAPASAAPATSAGSGGGRSEREGGFPVAVQDARYRAHEGRCDCGDCPHGAREGHRRAVAQFLARREEFASGQGLPSAVAHSAGASRQWVSDELAQSAVQIARRRRAEAEQRRPALWRRTAAVSWAAVVLLLLVQALTAIGPGWDRERTASLASAVICAALLTLAAYRHRQEGGVLALVLGADNRLSTSRAVQSAWLGFWLFATLLTAVQLLLAPSDPARRALLDGLSPGNFTGALGLLTVGAVAVVVRRVAAVRVRAGRLQKIPAYGPRAADLLTDDAGRASLADVQYVAVSVLALGFTAVRLVRDPGGLPGVPWAVLAFVLVSAVLHTAAKLTEGGRPVLLSVVRAREAGDLDGPIRTGDDIELRGTGFVPPGAGEAEQLTRLAVRFGAVQVHVPLVPVPGGFSNPSDTVLTVPVPVDVEPGPVDVQVVTAAGTETNRCRIEVGD